MKTEWFGNVTDGKMVLSEIGIMASKMWYEILLFSSSPEIS